ncbi:unnamed protein product [Coffea canephora]|uniref:Fe2OG dioxygenase domain-containing protein n=1 Tax=Coffea canephora TaxID=49390 RepID=A0A068UQ82_COFCA|nr:unnamed protein product [Coffea canephora]
MAGDSELDPYRMVQELAEDGDEIPERFICKDTPYGLITASLPLMDIPVIDLSRLSSSSATTDEELEKLQSALSSWGCFQVINHGIEFCLLDELRENGRQFLKLPMKDKQKYARAANEIEGYGNDMILYENQTLDWTDRIYLLVSPEDGRKLQYWPEDPKSFRVVLEEYAKRVKMIVETLLKSMAKALNLPDNSFLNQYGERPVMYTRYNFYPPCPRPDLVHGVKPHADGSAITVLQQDEEVEGLQFLKDNQWFRVPIRPHALIVNVGDEIEVMSNGIFKSPLHRALTNSAKERISVATFCSPEVGMEIGPVEELINDKNPRLYKTVKDYPELFFKYYQQGKRPIDAVKLYSS